MIKDFFTQFKGPHFFLTMLFLGMGLILLALGVKGYKEYSQKEINSDVSNRSGPDVLLVHDIENLLSSSDFSLLDVQVIADKNLFSPAREAWAPPPPSPPEEPKPTQRSSVNQRDFRLYGITQSGDEKTALIYYQQLPEKNKHRLVNDGEVVYDNQSGNELYKVENIRDDTVVLEAGGDIFTVSLFSHERQKVELGKTNQIAVVIGGFEENGAPADGRVVQPQPVEKQEPSAPSDQQGISGSEQDSGDVGLEQADEDQEPERLSRAERRSKLIEEAASSSRGRSIEDLERQVQEGTMSKVETELGTFYRRVVD